MTEQQNLDLSKVKSRIVKVDQAVAEMFLGYEKQPEPGKEGTNRKFSPDVVNNYAIDILSDQWPFHHQGMAFKGYLVDGTAEFVDGGQRCRAIIQAATSGAIIDDDNALPPNPNVFIMAMVTEGLDDAAVMAMDQNRRRQPHDFLVMGGEVSAALLASTVRLCRLYETVPWSPDNWKRARITPSMRREYLKENPGLRDAIKQGARVTKIMTPSSASAGYYLALKNKVEQKVIEEFLDALAQGINLDEDDAARVLREMMKNAKGIKGRKRAKYSREEQLALFIKAFKKWTEGVPTSQLMFRTAGESAERFPRF